VRRPGRRNGWILPAMLAGFLVMGSAPVALAAEPAVVDAPALSETEQAWLQENPALADIAASAPERLRYVLDKLAIAIANPSSTRGGLLQLDDETVRILEHNPALLQACRSSPEASADLLQLIRIAAGGGKPRK
jgi:hypothetical protein